MDKDGNTFRRKSKEELKCIAALANHKRGEGKQRLEDVMTDRIQDNSNHSLAGWGMSQLFESWILNLYNEASDLIL